MIETAELSIISMGSLAMDGIDALSIGPSDLAQDLGVFRYSDQAQVLAEKSELVLAAARKHGKACAALCHTHEQGHGNGRTRARCWLPTQATGPRTPTPGPARR